MQHLCTRAALAALFLICTAVHAQLRITSCGTAAGYGAVEVAGMAPYLAEGYQYLHIMFADDLIAGDTIGPITPGWHTNTAAVARLEIDTATAYQPYRGAHFWRALLSSNEIAASPQPVPAFEAGDGSGWRTMDHVDLELAGRSLGYRLGDGVFLADDPDADHYLVWSTNGVTWQSGWPAGNVPITGDVATVAGLPTKWRIAVRGAAVRIEESFALIPSDGEISTFYLSNTETTESSAADIIQWGVTNGYCTAGAYPALPGRGNAYPVAGLTFAQCLALCNVATEYHNAATGDALTPVYLTNGAAFYAAAGVDLGAVELDAAATGYRLPTRDEATLAARGDGRQRYPWGGPAAREYRVSTNGLPVTETIISFTNEVDFLRKYHVHTTNSIGNFLSRNGHFNVSAGRITTARSGYRAWSIPAVNTNGTPVMMDNVIALTPVFFGDELSDGAWGTAYNQCHDLSGNAAEFCWPPERRPWGGWVAGAFGGCSWFAAEAAEAGRFASVPCDRAYLSVGFRFARNIIRE